MVGFDSGDCYKSTFVAGGDGNFHGRFEYFMNEAVEKKAIVLSAAMLTA
jgi:hypothetical protein